MARGVAPTVAAIAAELSHVYNVTDSPHAVTVSALRADNPKLAATADDAALPDAAVVFLPPTIAVFGATGPQFAVGDAVEVLTKATDTDNSRSSSTATAAAGWKPGTVRAVDTSDGGYVVALAAEPPKKDGGRYEPHATRAGQSSPKPDADKYPVHRLRAAARTPAVAQKSPGMFSSAARAASGAAAAPPSDRSGSGGEEEEDWEHDDDPHAYDPHSYHDDPHGYDSDGGYYGGGYDDEYDAYY